MRLPHPSIPALLTGALLAGALAAPAAAAPPPSITFREHAAAARHFWTPARMRAAQPSPTPRRSTRC
jgi:hypothetical protein